MKFAAYSRVNGPQPGQYYAWEFPGAPVKIHLSLDVVSRMGADVERASKPGSRQAVEIGGILLGRVLRDGSSVIEIDDYEAVICESRNNNRYILSAIDRRKLEKAIAKWKSGSGSSVAGFYRSHLRPDLGLDSEDLSLMHTYFSDPSDVSLLVKPRESGVPTAGFFFWQDGQIHSRFSLLEFPFGNDKLSKVNGPLDLDPDLDWVKATASGRPGFTAPPSAQAPPATGPSRAAVPFVSNGINGTGAATRILSDAAGPGFPNGKHDGPPAAMRASATAQPAPVTGSAQSQAAPARPVTVFIPAKAPAIVSQPIAPQPVNRPATTTVPARITPENRGPSRSGEVPAADKTAPPEAPVNRSIPSAKPPGPPLPAKTAQTAAPLKEPLQNIPSDRAPRPESPKVRPLPVPGKPAQTAPLKPAPQTAPLKPAAQAKPAAAETVLPAANDGDRAVKTNTLFGVAADPGNPEPVEAGWLKKAGPKRLGIGAAVAIAIFGSLAALRLQRPATDTALALRVDRTAQGFKVNWNPNTALFAKAEGGLLSIRDGNFQKDLYLDSAQLHGGEAMYPPSNNDVNFRLDVFASGEKKNVTESVLIPAQAAPAAVATPQSAGLPPLAQTDASRLPQQTPASGTAPGLPAPGAAEPAAAALSPPQGLPLTAKPMFQPPASRPVAEATVKLEVPEPLATPAVHMPAQPIVASPIVAPPPVAAPASKVEQPPARAENVTAAASTQVQNTQVQNTPLQKPAAEIPAPPKAAPAVAAALPPTKLPEQTSASYIAPRSIGQVQPVVPQNMKSLIHGETQIDVRVSIDASGKVTGAIPMSPKGQIGSYLGSLAANSARLWKFIPAKSGGRNVPSEVVLRFRF